MIDERGRLFGRLNLIDAAALLTIILVIPLAFGAYLLFRRPLPEILAVEPSYLAQGEQLRVRVRGRHLLPYMHAQVGKLNSDGFLFESPLSAEIRLPRLDPGTYDLTLLDAAQELVRLPNAITIGPVTRRPADITVRLVLPTEVADQFTPSVRDTDALLGTDASAAATVTSVESTTVVNGRVTLDVAGADPPAAPDGYRVSQKYEIDQRMSLVTARLRVPLEQVIRGWRYKGEPVVVGAPFRFEGPFGIIHGWVVRVSAPGDAGGVRTDRP